MTPIPFDHLPLTRVTELTGGTSWWSTGAIPEAGIPCVVMADGPHGLRFQPDDDEVDHLGLNASIPATCFPPATALAATWSPELAARVGTAIAAEAAAKGVGVVLGPGINIKRSPLGGRNFEYFSEDPFLSGALGGAWVEGLQSVGVGASLKHFAVNSQETRRMTMDARVDERTLREIYLRAFETVVRAAKPWTVMCSYNRINGEWASQHRELLTGILRDEWGFDGAVVSDWGAVVDRPRALAAGLDLEMPPAPHNAEALIEAVREGTLDEAAVRRAAARVARLAARTHRDRPARPADVDRAHRVAREVAEHAIVLLRNDTRDGEPLLPLSSEQSVAIVGELARTPRYQGAGSSRVVPTRLDIPLDELRDRLKKQTVFAPGYHVAQMHGRYAIEAPAAEPTDADIAALRADAVAAATDADVTVVFLGLPPEAESEGYDRTDLELPTAQLELLRALLAVTDRIVVVLAHGGAVRIGAWAAGVPALVDTSLLGQACGSAIADVLIGRINPSGKLAETLPLRLEDTPTFLNFGIAEDEVHYGEGVLVGYRWYDARRIPVAFPFGHGLSYTSFAYADATIEFDGADLVVSFAITNTGAVAGREVAQVYTGLPGSASVRPPRELKGFAAVSLTPGQTRRVAVRVPRQELAVWRTATHRWHVEPGEYRVDIGASSRDLRLQASVLVVDVDGADAMTEPWPTIDSTIGDWLAHPHTGSRMREVIAALSTGGGMPTADSPTWRMFADVRLSQIAQLRPELADAERVRALATMMLGNLPSAD